jgi:hypothetical protein
MRMSCLTCWNQLEWCLFRLWINLAGKDVNSLFVFAVCFISLEFFWSGFLGLICFVRYGIGKLWWLSKCNEIYDVQCRTSAILNELKVLFVSATAIPVQVLLTGYSLPFSSHCLFFFLIQMGKLFCFQCMWRVLVL